MEIISQNAIKYGFFCQKGQNQRKNALFNIRFQVVHFVPYEVKNKKQRQFSGVVNWRNISNINDLWRFQQIKAAKKQTQFKLVLSSVEWSQF